MRGKRFEVFVVGTVELPTVKDIEEQLNNVSDFLIYEIREIREGDVKLEPPHINWQDKALLSDMKE